MIREFDLLLWIFIIYMPLEGRIDQLPRYAEKGMDILWVVSSD